MTNRQLKSLDMRSLTVAKNYAVEALRLGVEADQRTVDAVINTLNRLLARVAEAKQGVRAGTFKPNVRPEDFNRFTARVAEAKIFEKK